MIVTSNQEKIATFFIAVSAFIMFASIVLSFLTLAEARNHVTTQTQLPCTTVNSNTYIGNSVPFQRQSIAPQNYFEKRQFYIERLPEQNGRYTFTIDDITDYINVADINGETNSMKPAMGSTAQVLWRKLRDSGDVKIGDIIIFNATLQKDDHKETIIMHQVVAKNGAQYITKGFNNAEPDEYNTTINNTLGIVVGVLY